MKRMEINTLPSFWPFYCEIFDLKKKSASYSNLDILDRTIQTDQFEFQIVNDGRLRLEVQRSSRKSPKLVRNLNNSSHNNAPLVWPILDF